MRISKIKFENNVSEWNKNKLFSQVIFRNSRKKKNDACFLFIYFKNQKLFWIIFMNIRWRNKISIQNVSNNLSIKTWKQILETLIIYYIILVTQNKNYILKLKSLKNYLFEYNRENKLDLHLFFNLKIYFEFKFVTTIDIYK